MESSPESAAWLTIPAMRAGPRPRLRRSHTVRFSREVWSGPGRAAVWPRRPVVEAGFAVYLVSAPPLVGRGP